MAISLKYGSMPVLFLREETVHSGPDREGGVHRGDRVGEARERTRGKSNSKIYAEITHDPPSHLSVAQGIF
jgi:hypothetical protein